MAQLLWTVWVFLQSNMQPLFYKIEIKLLDTSPKEKKAYLYLSKSEQTGVDKQTMGCLKGTVIIKWP